MDYLQLTAPGALNPLAFMAAGLKNVTLVPPIEVDNATFDFLYQIENGCMCGVQCYQADAKIRSIRPPVLGWSAIIQQDGITDLAESRFVPLRLI